MIFRLKLFIPIVIIVSVISYGTYAYRNEAVKYLLESSVDGLTVKDLNIAIGDEVGADFKLNYKSSDQKELLSVGSSDFKMLTRPLGFGKVSISKINLKDLRLSKSLFEVKGEELKEAINQNIKDAVSNEEANESGIGIPKVDLKGMDHREILSRVIGQDKLKFEKKLKELDETSKSLILKWKGLAKDSENKLQSLKQRSNQIEQYWKIDKKSQVKSDVTNLKNQFNQLKSQKFDLNNLNQIATTYQQFDQLKGQSKTILEKIKGIKGEFQQELKVFKDLKQDAVQIKNLKNQLNQDKKLLEQLARETKVAAKEDLELLKKEINPKNFGATKITRLLFGKEWEASLIKYISIWNQVKEYLPKLDFFDQATSVPTEVAAQSEKIEPVSFKRNPNYPRWSIHEIAYEGNADKVYLDESVGFKGKFQNMSSSETIFGKAFRWDVEGNFKEKKGSFNLSGTYSKVKATQDDRYLNFHLNGRSMVGKTWGPSKMRVQFLEGNLSAEMKIDLSQAPNWSGKGSFVIEGAKTQVGEEVDQVARSALKNAIEKLLMRKIPFQFTYDAAERKPRIKFGGDLDDIFKDALKGTLKNLVEEKHVLLSQEFQKRVHDKVESKLKNTALKDVFGHVSSGLFSHVDQYVGSLSGLEQKGSMNQQTWAHEENEVSMIIGSLNGEKQARQALEQRLKNELKNKLEREAKKRLEAEAKKRLAEAAAKKAVSKKNVSGSIKEELKAKKEKELKKLKDKLRGFPF